MAIDTRDKRASVIGFNRPGGLVLPNPDGTINAGDRAQVAFTYSGIAGGTPVVSHVKRHILRRLVGTGKRAKYRTVIIKTR